MFHYLLNIIVCQFRVVSWEYFMDECTLWELNDMIDILPYMDRSLWETSRLNAYVVAQVNSKKKLTQQDILKFKWEKMDGMLEDDEVLPTTKEDVKRMQQLAKQLENVQWHEATEQFTTQETSQNMKQKH